MRRFPMFALLGVAVLACRSHSALAQVKIENPGEMKFAPVTNVPPCLTAAVEQGPPANGASTLLVKGTAGCDAPMHFHSVNEQLLMVSGAAQLEMKGEKTHKLAPAAFAAASAKHPHHFTCLTTCRFYLISDGPFDIHYIDESGKEIPFEQALQARKGGTAKRQSAGN